MTAGVGEVQFQAGMSGGRNVARGWRSNVANVVVFGITLGFFVFTLLGVDRPIQRWFFWAQAVATLLALRELVWKLQTPLLSITPVGFVWRRGRRDVDEVAFARVASWERYPARLNLTDVEGKRFEIELDALPVDERESATAEVEAYLRENGKQADRYYPGNPAITE